MKPRRLMTWDIYINIIRVAYLKQGEKLPFL